MPLVTRKPGRPCDVQLAERRKCDILGVAIRHFAKMGYGGADLDKLAKDAGCAKGTLFRYFPTKRALFEAAVDRVMREMLEAADAHIEDPVEDMIVSIRASLAFLMPIRIMWNCSSRNGRNFAIAKSRASSNTSRRTASRSNAGRKK